MNDNDGGKIITFNGKSDAIPDTEKDNVIWICGCGCQSFILHDDNTIQCTHCDNHIEQDLTQGQWARQVVRYEDVENDDGGTIIHNLTDDTNFSRLRTKKLINDWFDKNEVALAIVYKADGTSKSWQVIETQEQKDWLIRILEKELREAKSLGISE